MRSFALAAAFLAAAGGRAPLAAQEAPPPGSWAVLWVPAGAPDLAALETLLAKRPGLRLGLAVAPEELPAGSTVTLSRLWQEGRVEPLLRLPGDPVLPLSPSSSRELTPRLAVARQAFQREFGRAAEGFAPGGGALDDASARRVRAAGILWAAASGNSAAAFKTASGLDILPGKSGPPAGPGLTVFDEGSGLAAPGSGLAAIDAAAEGAAAATWSFPSALASGAAAETDRLEGRSWAGDLSRWNSRPAQALALARLASAAAELERYQNSGTAALETLDEASSLLRKAESGRGLAAAEEAAAEHAGLLIRFYELLGQRPPLDLLASTAAASAAGLVTSEASPGRIAFLAPSGSAGRCALDRLEVEHAGSQLKFSVFLATSAEAEAKRPLVDLYIDVNHRQGAGSARLLPGRPGFIRAADAWEFALELGEVGKLYRFVPPRPSPPERIAASWDAEARRLDASIPASRIKGNFASWGYLALCVESREPDGEVLSVLGTRAEQRQLADAKRKAKARFSAQRLTPQEAAKAASR